jgi:hypothetical protein
MDTKIDVASLLATSGKLMVIQLSFNIQSCPQCLDIIEKFGGNLKYLNTNL